MNNLGINISHNGPYTNVSTAPLCFSQTVRNIAVPMILSSEQRIITVTKCHQQKFQILTALKQANNSYI